jgi:LysM domain
MIATTMTPTVRRHPFTAIARLVEAFAVVGGFPTLLIVFVGWPLPHGIPTFAEVQRAYQIRYIPDRLIIGGLACAAWVCWASLAFSIIAGVLARLRATEFHRPTLVPAFVHRLAGRWIGAAALTVALFAKPASAALPQAKSVLVQNSRPVDASTAPPTSRPFVNPVTVRPTPSEPSQGRTYVTGDHDTYWQVAESTLGDGARWREILELNPTLGKVDLVPPGTKLNIPGPANATGTEHEVTVKKGDNLWKLAASELKAAHGDKPSNAEVAPYWKEVIAENTPELRSGNPNLIYPGEIVTMPGVDNDVRALTEDTSPVPPVETPVPTQPAVTTVPSTTAPKPTVPVAVTVVNAAAIEVDPKVTADDPAQLDDYEPFTVPWIEGLAITGVASAAILAAWHAQRRRRIRAHKLGDPIPSLTDNDRDLISQLRGIAETERLEATSVALRLLAAGAADGALPAVTVTRAGRHSVELLLDDPTVATPKHFVRLDQHTIVVNPGLSDDDIATAIAGVVDPSPAMIVLGTDDIGSVFVDLERIGAMTIETETRGKAEEVVAALLTMLATQPSAVSVRVHTLDVPHTVDSEQRITHHETVDGLFDAAEAHIQAQCDDVVANGTHKTRAVDKTLVPVVVGVLGPGHAEEATALAEAARESGSALAIVSCDPIPNTTWRLVMTGDIATIEPAGLNLKLNRLRPCSIDDEANGRLKETFGEPTLEPESEVAVVVEPEEGATDDSTVGTSPEPVDECVDSDVESTKGQTSVFPFPKRAEEPIDAPKPVDFGDFDQLILVREPVGIPLAKDLTVPEQIQKIMERKEIELVLLDGPPRLEGVTWDSRRSARVDEIVAFIMLNGPTTLRQLAIALWPDHPRPDNIATQMVSRTRKILGLDCEGKERLSVGNRAQPYIIHDVGCDWHRFEQLRALSEAASGDDQLTLLKAALSVVRSDPFEGARAKAFDWAADLCFDSRMRLMVSSSREILEQQIPA